MNLIEFIKEDIGKLEKTRTMAKIHISWAVRHLMARDPPISDLNPIACTLLGFQLVVHVDQVEPYHFEDVNGEQIFVPSPYARM